MFGLGSVVEIVSDKLGFPEELGDVIGIAVDLHTGNTLGAFEGFVDLVEGSAAEPAKQRCGYPAPDDAEGWMKLLNEQGIDAFMKAWKSGLVGKSVFEDKQFSLALQNAIECDGRYWQTLSNIQASQSRVLDNFVANLRA